VAHPNVVEILDICEDPKAGPFIVQEFLEGEDLDDYLERIGGRLPVLQLGEVVFPVIDAMALAHSRGVVHRDLKPSNVFLSRWGGKIVPKLLDFGISQITKGPENVRMTSTGVILGSPAYMPPEQIRDSRSADARSDVWSLGVILYEVLSGTLPFDTNNVCDLFIQISTVDAKSLKQTAPAVSSELARIVGRCLRRDPKERYSSATELLNDLRASPLGATFPPPAMRKAEPPKAVPFAGSLSIPKPAPSPPAPVGMARLPAADPQKPDPVDELKAKPEKPPVQRAALARPVVGDPVFTGGGRKIELQLAGQESDAGRPIRRARLGQAPPAADAGVIENPDAINPKSAGKLAVLLGVVSIAFFIILRRPDEVMKALWKSPLLGGTLPLGTAAVAVVIIVVGLAIAVEAAPGWRRSWGPLVSAAGFVLSGISLGLTAYEHWSPAEQAGPAEPSAMLPLAFSLIPLGLCVLCVQKAWEAWRKNTTTGFVVSAGFAALFALALFAAHTIVSGG